MKTPIADMKSTADIASSAKPGLERLCDDRSGDHIVHAAGASAMERIDVRMLKFSYAEHRHDSYALGLTLSGAQAFRYRGVRRISQPGNWLVLHPDELHDGNAGDDAGLHYRMLYLDPALLHAALPEGVVNLPFIKDAVGDDAAFRALLVSMLQGLDDEIEPLRMDGFVAEAAAAMTRLGGDARCRSKSSGRSATI